MNSSQKLDANVVQRVRNIGPRLSEVIKAYFLFVITWSLESSIPHLKFKNPLTNSEIEYFKRWTFAKWIHYKDLCVSSGRFFDPVAVESDRIIVVVEAPFGTGTHAGNCLKYEGHCQGLRSKTQWEVLYIFVTLFHRIWQPLIMSTTRLTLAIFLLVPVLEFSKFPRGELLNWCLRDTWRHFKKTSSSDKG